jgi:hypothetical protein
MSRAGIVMSREQQPPCFLGQGVVCLECRWYVPAFPVTPTLLHPFSPGLISFLTCCICSSICYRPRCLGGPFLSSSPSPPITTLDHCLPCAGLGVLGIPRWLKEVALNKWHRCQWASGQRPELQRSLHPPRPANTTGLPSLGSDPQS